MKGERNIGKYGEEMAMKHLVAKGYKMVEKNYKFMRAEIDIVVKNEREKVIVFAEVKTRRSNDFAEAEDSVADVKQHQILKAAEGFLAQNEEYEDFEKRFDVISVYVNGGEAEVRHFEDVF